MTTKKAWVRPKIQTIAAGSAEAGGTTTRNESSIKGNNKS